MICSSRLRTSNAICGHLVDVMFSACALNSGTWLCVLSSLTTNIRAIVLNSTVQSQGYALSTDQKTMRQPLPYLIESHTSPTMIIPDPKKGSSEVQSRMIRVSTPTPEHTNHAFLLILIPGLYRKQWKIKWKLL